MIWIMLVLLPLMGLFAAVCFYGFSEEEKNHALTIQGIYDKMAALKAEHPELADFAQPAPLRPKHRRRT